MKIVKRGIVTLIIIGSLLYVSALSQIGPSRIIVNDSAQGALTSHEIQFSTNAGLMGSGENMQITFDPTFSLASVTFTDIAMTFGPITGSESTAIISSTPSLTSWGASISGSGFVLTVPTSGSGIPAGNKVILTVQSILNPIVIGSHKVSISLSNNENKTLAVAINDGSDTGVSASRTDNVSFTVKWAVPQGRVGAVATNDSTRFFVDFANVGGTTSIGTSPIVETDNDGTLLIPTEAIGIDTGLYDVAIKSDQHLSRKLSSVDFTGGSAELNFTQSFISTIKGALLLRAGDINGTGVSVSTLGDDVVNAVDISVLLTSLDADDPTTKGFRANLNRDTVVNAVDLSLMLTNLDATGERW